VAYQDTIDLIGSLKKTQGRPERIESLSIQQPLLPARTHQFGGAAIFNNRMLEYITSSVWFIVPGWPKWAQ
jgi:hypothetical protein